MTNFKNLGQHDPGLGHNICSICSVFVQHLFSIWPNTNSICQTPWPAWSLSWPHRVELSRQLKIHQPLHHIKRLAMVLETPEIYNVGRLPAWVQSPGWWLRLAASSRTPREGTGWGRRGSLWPRWWSSPCTAPAPPEGKSNSWHGHDQHQHLRADGGSDNGKTMAASSCLPPLLNNLSGNSDQTRWDLEIAICKFLMT